MQEFFDLVQIKHTMNQLLESAKQIESEIIGFRRTIHENPELSFLEFETSAFIQQELTKLDIPFQVLAKTGVVAHIGKGERCVALRADIDALPIHEETDLAFASKNDGIMHACGHDAHTAMLLGAAILLKKYESQINGTVKLIFQLGEEKAPGGANMMIEEGVLENPVPEVIFGQHCNPDAPAGETSFVSGAMMAAPDELYWTIFGKSGHAAQPHLAIDPIFVAAQLISQLQSIISRNLNPFGQGVLSITSIHGGNATNIIPEKVEMNGTLRSMDLEWRENALQSIKTQSEMVSESLGCRCEFYVIKGYPPLVNDYVTTDFAIKSAQELLGSNNVTTFSPKMWGEDFAFYAQIIPACFWMLGVRPIGQNQMPNLHNCHFAPDESALYKGTALLAFMALRYLGMK